MIGKALSFTHKLYFFSFLSFSFYQYTALSSRAETNFLYSHGRHAGSATSTSNLAWASVLKQKRTGVASGGLKLHAMHSQLPRFLVLHYFTKLGGFGGLIFGNV